MVERHLLGHNASSLSTGPAALARPIIREGGLSLVVAERIHPELANTVDDAYFRRRWTDAERADARLTVRQEALSVLITVTLQGVATHPEADLILASAVSTQADYLVTGDIKLQEVG